MYSVVLALTELAAVVRVLIPPRLCAAVVDAALKLLGVVAVGVGVAVALAIKAQMAGGVAAAVLVALGTGWK